MFEENVTYLYMWGLFVAPSRCYKFDRSKSTGSLKYEYSLLKEKIVLHVLVKININWSKSKLDTDFDKDSLLFIGWLGDQLVKVYVNWPSTIDINL